MEYHIETFIKDDRGVEYSFITPAPYPTKEDAENVMHSLTLANPSSKFRVVTSAYARP